jgi:hypothetical protein
MEIDTYLDQINLKQDEDDDKETSFRTLLIEVIIEELESGKDTSAKKKTRQVLRSISQNDYTGVLKNLPLEFLSSIYTELTGKHIVDALRIPNSVKQKIKKKQIPLSVVKNLIQLKLEPNDLKKIIKIFQNNIPLLNKLLNNSLLKILISKGDVDWKKIYNCMKRSTTTQNQLYCMAPFLDMKWRAQLGL